MSDALRIRINGEQSHQNIHRMMEAINSITLFVFCAIENGHIYSNCYIKMVWKKIRMAFDVQSQLLSYPSAASNLWTDNNNKTRIPKTQYKKKYAASTQHSNGKWNALGSHSKQNCAASFHTQTHTSSGTKKSEMFLISVDSLAWCSRSTKQW